MRIGVAGPFNPQCVRDYFDNTICLPNINITASSVNTYVMALLELGHDVVVFTTDPSAATTKEFKGNRIKIYSIDKKFLIKGFSRYRIHRKIRKKIKMEINSLDILHAEWTYEYAYAMLPFVSQKKVYCSVRDWCPYLLSIAKGWHEKVYWKTSYYMFKKVMREHRIQFIANSNYTKDRITGDYPQNDVIIIPNPIQRSFICDSRDNYPDHPVFVSISQSLQNTRKNYKRLLEAFQLYAKESPNAELILIGWYGDDWHNEMDGAGLLHNVILKGSMNHDEIFDILDSSSCLIHPSLEETFGNILLEAMCRRIPCIGGESSGAVPQVLGYGKYGILCDVTDPKSMFAAMLKMEDRSIVDPIVNNCTQYLKETYADDVVAQMHISLFDDILQSKGCIYER